jgi:hypothetical protein
MLFKDAEALDLDSASDADVTAAWHAYAGQISYHHADDSGKEWGLASVMKPGARAIERELRNRGLDRPTGQYLMDNNDRIDWETGEWSRGWHWKKLKAEREARQSREA